MGYNYIVTLLLYAHLSLPMNLQVDGCLILKTRAAGFPNHSGLGLRGFRGFRGV